jgi:hypothetical protein
MEHFDMKMRILVACFGVALAACGGGSSSSAPSTGQPPTTAAQPSTIPTSTSVATTSLPTTTVPSSTVVPADTAIGVYGNCTIPSVEPEEIVFACADYGELLEALHWTSWTAKSAAAVGTLIYKVCVPNCADGGTQSVTGATVTLSDPVHGKTGAFVWSEAQVEPEPPGYDTGPYHGGPQPLATQPD